MSLSAWAAGGCRVPTIAPRGGSPLRPEPTGWTRRGHSTTRPRRSCAASPARVGRTPIRRRAGPGRGRGRGRDRQERPPPAWPLERKTGLLRRARTVRADIAYDSHVNRMTARHCVSPGRLLPRRRALGVPLPRGPDPGAHPALALSGMWATHLAHPARETVRPTPLGVLALCQAAGAGASDGRRLPLGRGPVLTGRGAASPHKARGARGARGEKRW